MLLYVQNLRRINYASFCQQGHYGNQFFPRIPLSSKDVPSQSFPPPFCMLCFLNLLSISAAIHCIKLLPNQEKCLCDGVSGSVSWLCDGVSGSIASWIIVVFIINFSGSQIINSYRTSFNKQKGFHAGLFMCSFLDLNVFSAKKIYSSPDFIYVAISKFKGL